jgi:hypothetical protein
MTVIATLSTIERTAAIANAIRFALGQIAIAMKRQTDAGAATALSHAMTALDEAQTVLGEAETDFPL